jgi:hypothetical protein
MPQNGYAPPRKPAPVRRPYRYLTVAKEDREAPRLVRERVKCGKPLCRCAQHVGHRHGPYWYLRWEQFDRETGETRYRREYVPAVELARVRQWVSRARTADARGRAILGYLRRSVRGVLYRERRRARLGASQRT